MRQLFLLLTLFVCASSFGQKAIKGQILSVIDSTPIANFSFRVDNKYLGKTNYLGFFSITSKKSKVRLSNLGGVYGIDTTFRRGSTDNIKLYTVEHCDSTLAAFDIQHNKMGLYCGAAFAPTASTPIDENFESEYHLKYFIVGDFWPSSIEQMIAYNQVIAQYFDKKYGNEWRAKIRPDVLGVPNEVGH